MVVAYKAGVRTQKQGGRNKQLLPILQQLVTWIMAQQRNTPQKLVLKRHFSRTRVTAMYCCQWQKYRLIKHSS